MCNTIKKFEIYESPIKERNEDKYGYGDNSCICCMKPMKEGKKKIYIHACTEWMAVDTLDEKAMEKAGLESQGLYEIGTSCAKKFPKEFIFKF